MSLIGCQDVCGGAVQGITTAVGAGEIVGLIGSRHAGKTGLLRLIAGRVRPTAGSVTVLGRPAVSAAARRVVGYAGDPPGVPAEVTGVEWVRHVASVHGIAPGRALTAHVAEALALGGLEPAAAGRRVAAYRRPDLLRLALAGAALAGRCVLLLDEPLAGADPILARDVRQALSQLAGQGRAVVVASHDLRGIERVATRVLVLERGRLRADVATGTLLRERIAELSLNGGALRGATWLLARFPGAVRTGDGVAVPLVAGLSVEQILSACRCQRIAVAGTRIRYRALDDLLGATPR